MNSRIFKAQSSLFSTSTINQLTTEILNNIEIAYPEVESEQSAIAAYLDAKTAQIDRFMAAKQKLIALLKEERTGIINQAVTKGLNPNVPMKPSGIEWLGDIPKHWETIRVKRVADIQNGFSPEQASPSEKESIPYFKVDNLNKYSKEIETPESYVNSKFKVTDIQCILFPKRGAAIFLNKVGISNGSISFDTNIMGLMVKSGLADVNYVYYLLKSISLENLADVSTIPQINNKHIEPLIIPYPPINEQQEISEYLEFQLIRIEKALNSIQREIELMQEYRTALINEVVTGKICVV
jgi:type I restriction enzyme S subunit